jgi:glycosyltransferase involved in cell wall biosynthesis
LISVWGNDFTLHARATPWMAKFTRLALNRAAALHTDCKRDLRLARRWGFPADRPGVVLPGGGGVQMDIFYPAQAEGLPSASESLNRPVVINPRGVRAYVRNDTFFRAIPQVLARRPEVKFVCPSMAGENQIIRWLQELEVAPAVELLPKVSRASMAELFRRAQVAVSLTTHDGTPNTLLEAMACGCFPIAGDIESLHEWITPGINGLLVDPSNSQVVAQAILAALEEPDLRRRATAYNLRLVRERAEHERVMESALRFYEALVGI